MWILLTPLYIHENTNTCFQMFTVWIPSLSLSLEEKSEDLCLLLLSMQRGLNLKTLLVIWVWLLTVNFSSHMKTVTKSVFYHLKKIDISKLRGPMSSQDLERMIHPFISGRIDCHNGFFTGLPKKTTRQLQLVQNAAARVHTQTITYHRLLGPFTCSQ